MKYCARIKYNIIYTCMCLLLFFLFFSVLVVLRYVHTFAGLRPCCCCCCSGADQPRQDESRCNTIIIIMIIYSHVQYYILYYSRVCVCVCARSFPRRRRRRGGGALIAGKSRPADHRYQVTFSHSVPRPAATQPPPIRSPLLQRCYLDVSASKHNMCVQYIFYAHVRTCMGRTGSNQYIGHIIHILVLFKYYGQVQVYGQVFCR